MENINSEQKKENKLNGLDRNNEISEEYCEFIPEESD